MKETREHPDISMSAELSRKALHLLSLVIPIGLFWFGRETALLILIPLSTLAALVEVLRCRSNVVRNFVDTCFGFMMRPQELPPIPAPIRFNGATWVLITATVLTAVFPIEIAAAAIAMGLIGDAAAALVGRSIGQTHIFGSEKTVEGTIAFVVAAAPVVFVVPGLVISAGLVGAIVGACVEATRMPLNDNFSVPVAIAVSMIIIPYAF